MLTSSLGVSGASSYRGDRKRESNLKSRCGSWDVGTENRAREARKKEKDGRKGGREEGRKGGKEEGRKGGSRKKAVLCEH
jgi:hypothetical protein